MSDQIDASIPVLTEIILPGATNTSQAGNHVSGNKPLPNQAQAKSALQNLDEVSHQAPLTLSEDDWQKLEQTLRENVLRQVLSRVDFVLEHRVRDSLADVLQTAVESLAVDIRGGLHKTMEEVITRAVTQEITKAKTTK